MPGEVMSISPSLLTRTLVSTISASDRPAAAPVQIEIARRQDRHEHGGVRELIDNLIGKNLVPLQFVVAPDFGCLAESHAQECLECGVKAADPAFLFRRRRLVVDVRVADEEVFFKTRHNAYSESQHHRLHRE